LKFRKDSQILFDVRSGTHAAEQTQAPRDRPPIPISVLLSYSRFTTLTQPFDVTHGNTD
jgi:hypothetical protein